MSKQYFFTQQGHAAKLFKFNGKAIIEKEKIDTIFFTRHLHANKDIGKWKNEKLVRLIMGDRAKIEWTETTFRNIEQTIYYFSTWKFYHNIDKSFLSKLSEAC
mgnify:CR=1 FL=1